MTEPAKLIFAFPGTREELDAKLQLLGQPKYGTVQQTIKFCNYNAVNMRLRKSDILDENGNGPMTRDAYDIGASSRREYREKNNVHYLHVPEFVQASRPHRYKFIEKSDVYTSTADFSDVAKWLNHNIENADTIQFQEIYSYHKKPGSSEIPSEGVLSEALATAWTDSKMSDTEIRMPIGYPYRLLKNYAEDLTMNKSEVTYQHTILNDIGRVEVLHYPLTDSDKWHNQVWPTYAKEKIFVTMEPNLWIRSGLQKPDIHLQYAETMGFDPNDSLSQEEFIRAAVHMNFHAPRLKAPDVI